MSSIKDKLFFEFFLSINLINFLLEKYFHPLDVILDLHPLSDFNEIALGISRDLDEKADENCISFWSSTIHSVCHYGQK